MKLPVGVPQHRKVINVTSVSASLHFQPKKNPKQTKKTQASGNQRKAEAILTTNNVECKVKSSEQNKTLFRGRYSLNSLCTKVNT